MIGFVLAVALGQPCMAPMKPHTRKHHLSTPVQTCVTPPVPMCFREPAPDPDLLPIAAPLIYYTPSADTPTAGDSVPQPTIYEPTYFGPIGGGVVVAAPVTYRPPSEPRGVGPTRAPEIDPRNGMTAVILLVGGLTIIRSRKV